MSDEQEGLPPELRLPATRSLESEDDLNARQRRHIEQYEDEINRPLDDSISLTHLAYQLLWSADWFEAPREWVEAALDWRDRYAAWLAGDD